MYRALSRDTEQASHDGRRWPAYAVLGARGPIVADNPEKHLFARGVHITQTTKHDALEAIRDKYPADYAHALRTKADALVEAAEKTSDKLAILRARQAARAYNAEAAIRERDARALRIDDDLEQARAQQQRFLDESLRRSARREDTLREQLLARADELTSYGRFTEAREIRSSLARSEKRGDLDSPIHIARMPI
jgi:hypothetical protein